MLKIGIGYDLHRLVPGRKLWIGGVDIPYPSGELAHSDGDVLIHSIIDAFVSPLGLGDIGKLFPDNDSDYKDKSGLELLKVVKDLYLKSVEIMNIDCVVILDNPKIGGIIPEMRRNISSILDMDTSKITIKGKTSENTKILSIESYVVVLFDQKSD